MSAFSLPFWIILQRKRLPLLPVDCPSNSRYVATFSTAKKATAFMLASGDQSHLELKLISRPTLPDLLADFQRVGVLGICHDPAADGTDGTRIALAQLLAQFPP